MAKKDSIMLPNFTIADSTNPISQSQYQKACTNTYVQN